MSKSPIEKKSNNNLKAALSEVISKIKYQPFLFVLGIAIIFVIVLIQGIKVSTYEFRLAITVIFALALIAILGYYAYSPITNFITRRMNNKNGDSQEMLAENGGKIKDSRQEGTGSSQTMSAFGKGSSIENSQQISGKKRSKRYPK
jgi:ABC-type bacteriocin/lantibiotic exporter with double-glycine peptidase domain